jgi:PAS domain S-box-containing protein
MISIKGSRSLSTRLIVTFVAVIVATTVAAGVPAYWLVRSQLEQQAWARVADGERITLALLEAEQARLADLAALTAQRPTLQTLLEGGGPANALSDYLRAFQTSVELDMLVVRDASGQPLAGSAPLSAWPDLPFTRGAAFQSLPGSEPGLILVASQPVLDNQSDRLLGYVTAGIWLDDGFTRQLAAQTGFGQSVLLDGDRVATSLEDAPPAVDSEAVERATASGQSEAVEVRLGGVHYYTALMPIRDEQGEVAALVEVALPVDGLIAAENRALLALILSTLLVAAIGSALGGLYARQLTAPLRQLTTAASNISRGDLATPVHIPKETAEIATLAAALEESRVNIHRALDDLSQAKAWSETLIQSLVEGIVTFDTQGHITFFSQGAERITGWSSEEALGQLLNNVFRLPDGNADQFMERIPPRGGKRQIGVLARGGRLTTLAVTGARLIPPTSDTVQVALVLRDITEEEAVQNLRSYFLANISHEFRTPLSALNASVELLLDEVEHLSPAEIQELLNSIHMSVTGLQTLIENLLESINIEAGRVNIRRCSTDLDEVCAEAIRVMQPLLDRRQQRLSLTKPPQLPLVSADPIRLTQVLVNLLSNASKYSPMGQAIDLSVEWVGDNLLRVAVADRGPGISPTDRKNLFRRFVRFGAQDGAQYGIGLGLSVVKAIVEEHGGEVGVDERPGGGSIFWFTLPLTGGEA